VISVPELSDLVQSMTVHECTITFKIKVKQLYANIKAYMRLCEKNYETRTRPFAVLFSADYNSFRQQ
jgi:hypothetical protein